MPRVGVVLVTHDAQQWLGETLDSIAAQSVAPDRLVVVDDASADGTRAILEARGIPVLAAATTATDVTARIAANFEQGVRACSGCDLVALGDHDDIWHPGRLAHQAGLLAGDAAALMVASDGRVIDATGRATGATLRQAFPVPAGWAAMAPAERMRHAVRRSLATGGASMIRPAGFPDLDVPPGWLHDRWWSLVATAAGGLVLDDATVIDYRVQAGQQVGLDPGRQRASGLARAGRAVAGAGEVAGKLRDLHGRLRPVATDETVRAALGWWQLAKALR